MVNFIEKFLLVSFIEKLWTGLEEALRADLWKDISCSVSSLQCGVSVACLTWATEPIMIRSSCKFFLFTLFFCLRILKENIMIRSCKFFSLFRNSKRKHYDKIMHILCFYLRIIKENIMVRSCKFCSFICKL